MKFISLAILSILFFACKDKEPRLTAQIIVDRAIQESCRGNCDRAAIKFEFRGHEYRSTRKHGAFILERTIKDSTTIVDKVSNSGFNRTINGQLVTVADSLAKRYSNSVNSVHYFAQLPYGLNAPAVQKEFLGTTTIKGTAYYQIGVTFEEEGGGTDFEDQFIYWIHSNDYTVDYFAYSYTVNGGGIRFREAFNPRKIEGIRFVDYNNYKPASLEIPLIKLPELYEKGHLQLLSKIETEKVTVQLVK